MIPHSVSSSSIPGHCKLKGTAIKNLKTYITAKIGSDFFDEAAQTVNLLRSGLILPSNWYPAENFIQLQQISARKLNMTDREFGIDSARYILEEDLNGVYRFFMSLGGPSLILGKLPQMANAYGNFIQMNVEINRKGYLKASFNVPTSLAEWYCVGSEGAIIGILNVCKQPLKHFRILEKTMRTGSDELATWSYELEY